MRVLINGVPLLSNLTGIGRYIFNLASSLKTNSQENGYYFFYRTSISQEIKNSPSNLQNIKSKFYGHDRYLPYWAGDALKRFCFYVKNINKDFDLYHETMYIPMGFDGPIVSTVYDLSVTLFPKTHPIGRVKLFEKKFERDIFKAKKVICISENTKRDLVRLVGYPENRITVTYLGCDKKYEKIDDEKIELYRIREKLPEKFILYVGTIEPRKNIELLIRSYIGLDRKIKEKHPIVIAGQMGWYDKKLDMILNSQDVRPHLIKLGYVPESELPLLYNAASLFVYPSLYEGFGLPPLEAMACGCPVITSNSSSLPEVVGDGGLVVDPHDEEGLKEKIEMILTDEKSRKKYSNYGLERKKIFSWDRCAKETLEVYRKALL